MDTYYCKSFLLIIFCLLNRGISQSPRAKTNERNLNEKTDPTQDVLEYGEFQNLYITEEEFGLVNQIPSRNCIGEINMRRDLGLYTGPKPPLDDSIYFDFRVP